MTDMLPPALWLLLAAIMIGVVRGKARTLVAVVFPIVALVHAWSVIRAESTASLTFLDHVVRPVAAHPPSGVFATIFCLMAVAGALFGANRDRPVELAGAMVYAGGALGVVFSGDWISLFVFWEVMTLGSTTIIWSARHAYAQNAGLRYFALHAVGGVLLLAGIAWHLVGLGSGDASLGAMGSLSPLLAEWQPGSAAAWLILAGMLINAGAPPFSAWIPDAYPAATESGTVWLSAYTTKTAVFTLLLAFAGSEVLIYFGMYMACYGIVYAILENDIRRVLAYAIVNQVGFMLIGIGVGTALAIDAVTVHAFGHIVYKALLLMAFGAVIQRTGRQACSEVGGLARSMPWAMGCAVVGLLAMSSLPFTSGYTTKSLITTATHDHAAALAGDGAPVLHLMWAWWILKVTSVGVLLFAGLKLLWFVFLGRDAGLRPAATPWNMRLPMLAFAGLSLLLGIHPEPLYALLPSAHEGSSVVPELHYGLGHGLKGVILAMVTVFAFAVLVPFLGCTRSVTIDTDWFYRRSIPRFWHSLLLPPLRILGRLQAAVMEGIPSLLSQRLRSEGGLTGLGLHRDFALGVVVAVLVLALFAVLLVGYLAG